MNQALLGKWLWRFRKLVEAYSLIELCSRRDDWLTQESPNLSSGLWKCILTWFPNIFNVHITRELLEVAIWSGLEANWFDDRSLETYKRQRMPNSS